MNCIKETNITCYFFDDIINTKMFSPNRIKTDKKSYRRYHYLLH